MDQSTKIENEVFFADKLKTIPSRNLDAARKFFSDKHDYFAELNGPSYKDLLSAKKSQGKKFGPYDTYTIILPMKSALNLDKKLGAFKQVNDLFKAIEHYHNGTLYHKDENGLKQPFIPELQNEPGELFSKEDETLAMKPEDFSETNFLKLMQKAKFAAPEYEKQIEKLERKLGYKPQRISYRDRVKHGLKPIEDNNFSKEEAKRIVNSDIYESIGEFIHEKAKGYYKAAQETRTERVEAYDHIFKVLFSMDFLADDCLYAEPKEKPEVKTGYSNSDQLARTFPKPHSFPVLFEPQKIYAANMVAGFYDKPDRYTIPANIYNKTYLKEVISKAKEITPENTKQLEQIEELFGLNKKRSMTK